MLSLLLLIIFLGFVLSIDSFGVGFTYGVRKILIPIRSLYTIMVITGTVIFVSMSIGHGLSRFISPHVAKMLGGLLLIILGCWTLYNFYKTNNKDKNKTSAAPRSQTDKKKPAPKIIQLKNLRIVIEILETPMKADVDQSGWISMKEAAVLGTALSLDAFGAGIGAAFLGYPIVLTPIIIAIMSGIFVYLGILAGAKFANLTWVSRLGFLPSCLLIIIGIYKLF
ncbi:sporulation membrane protein YtaF [Ectobacillus panaciterrae]|uniref:sporulation membrane protein YtaF n=1 Tax=Ectobacillus panaciterrae TaxID=363872 RepID=UPI0003FD7A51|nr:sporulation membrane protein YtaF [Ectobacillus panaciterrae]